jgi:hypothetical protein
LPNCEKQRATVLRAKFWQAGESRMTDTNLQIASKVPEVTLVFWIIKIAATTLGETGGDTVTMTLDWGYLAGTALFLSLLVVLSFSRSRRKNFIRHSIGRPSSPPRPPARRWPTSPIGRSVSAMPAARWSCWLA